MNIKRAKEEIKDTIAAYLLKDEFGEYKIPAIRQRPVLLIGPPGVGKTQIMEQIARECEIGLVAYTITHHTRQSAVGLPFIEHKIYGGKEYSVTEYTMSEIIASVYEKIEETGCKEGILFIDEAYSLVEDGKSLFDIMQDCLDQTLMNVGEMYVLYDDFGSLSLKNIANLAVNILIDSKTGENYKYSSSIDDQTYNKIKLVYDNKNTGQRDVYIAQDSSKMNEWGMLQYYDKLSEGENGKEKVESLLQLYNRKSKSFQITNAIGDVSVRAGCLLPVILDLGVAKVQSMMLVESCKHVFRENENFMNLTLRGGDFV